MKRPPRLILIASTLVIGASLLHAGSKPWKPAAWKVPKEQFNVITAVDVAASMVSVSHKGGKDKQDRNLKVTAFTEIVVEGNKATIATLKPGMHVDYTLADSETAAHIETVTEHAPPPTPVATATPSFPGHRK